MTTSVAQAEAQYERLPLPLGVSLPPGDAHALSVSMPAWEDVVGYEEARPGVIDAMACGYPRFFRHPFVKQLEAELKRSFAPFQQLIGAWNLMVVPTEDVAKRLHAFLSTQDDVSQADRDSAAVHSVRDGLAWVVIFHDALTLLANRFWQHTGEIVSSRHAERLLELLRTDARGHQIVKMHGTPGHAALRERVAGLYFGKTNAAANARNVAVYPTGMGGIFAALRLLTQFQKDAKAILFGFPYLDTLKLLQRTQWCPAGVHFFPVSGEKELMAVEEILKKEKILAIFTEFPSNPLLSLPDLDKLAALAHEHGTYLVVDDTVGSYNTNALKNGTADIVCTSLAKIFSGTCNVMAGSVVLNPQGASYDAFLEHLTSTSDSFLVEEDAKALNKASVDLEERIARVNASTSVLVKRLQSHKAVKALYYPELGSTADVERFRRYASSIYSGTEQPSFGPLFSVVLHGGEQAARAFYDTMKVAKGPSLGTNFTLACPYTVIAHYYELDYVESCGVDRNLVRISIGLEDPETLWATLQDALGAAESILHRQQQ